MILLDNISFSYPNKEIFLNAQLEINSGDFVFVVGESGIGKTTLALVLADKLKDRFPGGQIFSICSEPIETL